MRVRAVSLPPWRGLAAGRFLLLRALVLGPLREHPARGALAILAVALGVALGVAVHLVNASAAREFEHAARQLAGEADLVIRGAGAGFDERLYPRIARLRGVEAANPGLELEVALAGRAETLKIVGFDPLRAALVQPALLPERERLVAELLDPDALLLSPAAARSLDLEPGQTLALRAGTSTVTLRVIGLLPEGAYPQRVGLMDIAAAQWRFARLGRLNRIDLRLKPGADPRALERELAALLPPGVHALAPETEGKRGASLSRAYRVNLDLLALIALFTGAFFVYSSQVLALLRRRTQLALLRSLGVTRARLATLLAAEAALLGALGSALGLAAGWALARYALARFGADLGAGYFRGLEAPLRAEPGALALYFALGVACAVLGAAAPALEAARRPPAQALRAGDEEQSRPGPAAARWGLAALAAAALAALAPPAAQLPVGGYAAIGLLLLGSVLLMPRLVAFALERAPEPRQPSAALAVAQLQATPRQAAISAAAIVISTSLMVSMLIMVHSFRGSLERWLERAVPADLYVRAADGGEAGWLAPELQACIASAPGVARTEFLRFQRVALAPERPPVVLIARTIEPEAAARVLPLLAAPLVPGPAEPPPAWVSEVAAELYGMRPGDRIRLPLGDRLHAFTVAGVWRDYARQSGAIAIERELYVRLTGDRTANDAALWLAPGASPDAVARALRERLGAQESVEIAPASEVRSRSLALFDRTFAVTYALEVAAIVVGLLGVAVSFSAQALARRREFGVLRHLGMTRPQVAVMLGVEGALTAALGVALGMAVGWSASLVLVHVVNRQSFHWSLDLYLPAPALAGLGVLIVVAALAVAAWSGRAAMREEVVRAVREDW